MSTHAFGSLLGTSAYEVTMATPVGSQVWFARRDNSSFADVAKVVGPSEVKQDDHLVLRFINGSGKEYRCLVNELKLVTNERIPLPHPNPFTQTNGTEPLTVKQARDVVKVSPQFFVVDNGPSTVDTNREDSVVEQQLATTHVRVVSGATFQNCLDFALGPSLILAADLAQTLTIAEQKGMEVLPIGDPAATVDLWGELVNGKMRITHGTRLYDGPNQLWGSVTGLDNPALVLHTRYALAGAAYGSGYGQVIASLRGNRV